MASRPPLAVWLYGIHIATLSEPQYGKLRLDFNTKASPLLSKGSTILSVALPFDLERRPNADRVRGWFDAILPEGDSRTNIARLFGIRPGDDYGLLGLIGKDCAGAVILQSIEDGPPRNEGEVLALDESELEELIFMLPQRPLGAGERMRVSLAGMQQKLLLAETPDGKLGRPVNGAPSTWILKPEDSRLGGYAEAEAYSLGMAKHLGLTNVTADVISVAGQAVLKVSRYDRISSSSGIERIHQEDATQALGLDLSMQQWKKYEAYGGPSLKRFAELLRHIGRQSDLEKMLALTVLNVVIGNADAHARNMSILHYRNGRMELAPGYDLTPTAFYRGIPTRDGVKDMSDELGMFINGKRSVHQVNRQDLLLEGENWGLSRIAAAEVIERAIQGIRTYIEQPVTSKLPASIMEFFAQRLQIIESGG